MTRPISDVTVLQQQIRALIARQRIDRAVDQLRALLAPADHTTSPNAKESL
ncbi:hypothetical protein ACWD25_53240 [Streptomyces sp. NPDC002920]